MGRVIHFELPADDPERAVRFYESVFGWKIAKWEGPLDYWLVTTGEGTAGIDGAIMRRGGPFQGTINTIDVTSVDDAVRAVLAQGGSVVEPKMAVPGVGWMAYCSDPDGNLFGLMQEDTSAA